MGKPVRTWGGLRDPLPGGGGHRSVTVTFVYGDECRTLVAPSRQAAYADAVTRWGAGWDGEPCVSSPDTIYNDLIGWTKAQHGQDFYSSDHWRRGRERFRRTGESYRCA